MSKSLAPFGSVIGVAFALGWATTRAGAQDVDAYEVIRFEYFTQATTNRASTDAAAFHNLGAYLNETYPGSVQSATIKSPKGWTEAMDSRDSYFDLPQVPGETVGLPQSAPAGAYHFDVIGASGEQQKTVSLPEPANGLAPVRIANFNAAQKVDASRDFQVEWEQVIDRTAHDFLSLHVIDSGGDKIFDSGDVLLGQTALTIPAGTLQPNRTYTAYLYLNHYSKLSKGQNPPHWFTAESRGTRFTIKTLNPAGIFRFFPRSVIAMKTNDTAVMSVERLDGTEGDVTVDYYSTDGTATAYTEYSPVAGTLKFLAGETQQSFAVPLLDDKATNPPLTVHFTLTNATGGAKLATRPHANLTIVDPEMPPGTNVAGCVLARVEFYDQTNASMPTQAARSVRCRWFAAVHPTFAGSIRSAWVQLPNGSSRTLGTTFENYQYATDFSEDFPSRTSLNKTYKPGKYTLHFRTLSDGSFSNALSFGAERSLAVPHLTNWVDAQAIDAGAPFELKWAPFAGATTNDFISILVTDDSGEYLVWTPTEFEPGALPGTTTSFTIPPKTLDYGKRYFLDLVFSKMSSAGKPTAQLRTGIASVHTTGTYIKTAPAP
jgi:Calx-beta domain